MRKRTKYVKTPADIEAAIKRHQSRIKRSVNAIDKLQRQLKRSLNAEYAKTNAALTAEIGKPDAGGCQSPTPVPQPLVQSAHPAEEDIPAFLLRKPLSAESQQVAAEVAEKKKAKAKAQAQKRKAIAAERKQRQAIPKSKLRWDTDKSRWTD